VGIVGGTGSYLLTRFFMDGRLGSHLACLLLTELSLRTIGGGAAGTGVYYLASSSLCEVISSTGTFVDCEPHTVLPEHEAPIFNRNYRISDYGRLCQEPSAVNL
jgi:hypothetical protein